ncbi:hypothetical protein GOBAR_DD03838 [Gossypium barbadense]|nr:hypothetical protein GOBAR_DD03838 [Gossypium barbadense]
MIRTRQLCGEGRDCFLQQKGFPEVALHFVKDGKTRFKLGYRRSGNHSIAVCIQKPPRPPKEIDDKDHWYEVGWWKPSPRAMEDAEDAEVQERRYGPVFTMLLYLGDIQERVKNLENAGHLPLAYVTASVPWSYHDVAERSWIWFDADGLQNGDVTAILEDGEVAEDNEEGGWDLEDLELPPEVETPRVNARSSVFVAPTPGMPVSQIWTQRSSLAADHAAAGNFDTAMRLLSRQLGIRNFTPLKSMFLDLHTGSHSYLRAFSSAPVVSLAVERGWSESSSPNVRGPPALIFNFSQLDEKLKAGYKATTDGKFTEALRLFLNILHTIPLIVVESRREVDEVKELIIIAKEYVLGLQMELKRRELKDNPVRQQELAAYFTHCNLQIPHLRLALRNAMTICFKAKNLATAANFARRLLETNPNENHSKAARQVLQASERNMTDASQLNYDFRNPFVTCGATYVPIYRGQKDVSCPYCTTRFVPTQEGQLCTICDLAVIGADASGLLGSPSQIR